MSFLVLSKVFIVSLLCVCVAFWFMPFVTVLPLCNPDNFGV